MEMVEIQGSAEWDPNLAEKRWTLPRKETRSGEVNRAKEDMKAIT
jgi:hypothetical protein